MNLSIFLRELKTQGVEVVLSDDGNNLKINYTNNNLSESLINKLKVNKTKIIDYLNSANQVIPKADFSETGYPLTPSQKRAWILSQIEGYNFAYNMYETLVFEGELDEEKLELAFKDLINAHEILRTVIKENEKGEVRQYVKSTEDLDFKVEVEDLKNIPDAEEKIKPIILNEIKVIFNLSSGPLIKCKLYHISENKWVCLFIIHHIICDSRSFDVLKRDLLLAYNSRLYNNSNGLQPYEIQYKDFAVWRDTNLKGDQLKKQKEYWLKQFEGELPVLELPIDKKRPAQRMVEAGMIKRKIGKELTNSFVKYCANQGYTLFTGLMSLFNLLFYKYTNQTDIILGFPMYGREYTELENLIGFFADTLALRTKFEGENTFEELLYNVNKRAFEAYEHKDYPFEELITELNPIRDSSRTIFFDVFVVLQNFKHATAKEKEVNFGNLTVNEFKGENTRYAAFDLIINCSESEEGLTYALEYNRSIFNDNTIEQFANHIEELMSLVLENPKVPIKRIDFLTIEEKQQVLEFGGAENNQTETIENSLTTTKNQSLDFSLFYFGNKGTEKNNYQLLIEGAKYADENNYSAVWTPERHFNEFGGPYPNPSVLGASLATITKNVSIRSGSIVVPLHHPTRIVEEWSVVDNLSGGRVGMCLASGWNANDFILMPENYEKRNKLLYKNIEEIKELWKGNPVSYKNAYNEDKLISTFPKPIQEEVPMWIASGGSIETFKKAGEIGAGILTGLLNTTFEELAEKIKIYRQSYAKHNHPKGKDSVVLMLHTYIDKDEDTARNIARIPMSEYLSKSVSMSKKQANSSEVNELADGVTEDDVKELLSYTVEKYFDKYSLIGTEESCLKILNDVKKAGIDEVACLIDFGIEHEKVLNSLSYLTKVKDAFNKKNLTVDEVKIPKSSRDINIDKSIIDIFQEQALKTPDNIALRLEKESITYKELEEKSNQVAHYLKENNVQSGEAVALYLDRSLEMIIGMLGILKSGAVYVPIDLAYPVARIEYMLRDCRAKCILSQLFNSGNKLKEQDLKVLSIEKSVEGNFSKAPINLVKESNSDAYIIYTSGSTGKPKGVPITHNNLFSFFESINGTFTDRIQEICSPILASNAFDIFLFESLYPILTGGTSVMVANETIQNIEVLLESLKEVNAFHSVPALMTQLINHIKNTKANVDYGMIKNIFIGGDVVPFNIITEIKNIFYNADIHVLYGPTESTIFVTTHTVEKTYNNTDNQLLRGSVIGSPNTNVEIYILNDELQLNPLGIVGEICIGGPTIAKGYLNRLEETREKFVENPLKIEEKIYKTGDLGRWLADGTIEFIGRKDQQVKIRGFRIELREIEYVLQQQEAIELACVIVKTNREGEKELIAHIVSKQKQEISKLRNILLEKLPQYMVPTHFIQLEKMPLTSNGKIDRKKIISLKGVQLQSNIVYVAPRNEVDEKLVSIWKEILDVDKIGIKDNFFDLGGNSLKATRLLNYLHKEFDLKLNLLTIFNTLTIELLSDEIDRMLWVNAEELEESDSENYII